MLLESIIKMELLHVQVSSDRTFFQNTQSTQHKYIDSFVANSMADVAVAPAGKFNKR